MPRIESTLLLKDVSAEQIITIIRRSSAGQTTLRCRVKQPPTGGQSAVAEVLVGSALTTEELATLKGRFKIVDIVGRDCCLSDACQIDPTQAYGISQLHCDRIIVGLALGWSVFFDQHPTRLQVDACVTEIALE